MIASLLLRFGIPGWLGKLIGIVLLAGALIGGWQWREAVVEQRGYDRAVAECKAADDKYLAEASEEARKETIALQEMVYQEAFKRQEDKVKYEKAMDDLRADARRGNSGMRAPGRCVHANPASSDSGVAGRPGAEEGFVLLPETAESVLDAASDSRNDVLARNALIDLYNKARAACNSSN